MAYSSFQARSLFGLVIEMEQFRRTALVAFCEEFFATFTNALFSPTIWARSSDWRVHTAVAALEVIAVPAVFYPNTSAAAFRANMFVCRRAPKGHLGHDSVTSFFEVDDVWKSIEQGATYQSC